MVRIISIHLKIFQRCFIYINDLVYDDCEAILKHNPSYRHFGSTGVIDMSEL